MDSVVNTYEKYKEEERFTTSNAKRVEYITTTRKFDNFFNGTLKILDCAAGTGAYSFYLAGKGHDVTAIDLTPRHIEYIQNRAKETGIKVEAKVMNAVDLSYFADETFDVVLNMGAFYHLPDNEERSKSIQECLRVLKNGGHLFTSYIPKHFILTYEAASNAEFINSDLAVQILNTGAMKYSDKDSFWTDSYFATPEEMIQLYKENGLVIMDHFAQDGIAPSMPERINAWSEEQFHKWCEYHYRTCQEASILGVSNHCLIVGRKGIDLKIYQSFEKWLNHILVIDLPLNIVAFNFNIYEAGKETYDIQLTGTDIFNDIDDEWASSEVYTSGEDVFIVDRIEEIERTEDGQKLFEAFIQEYLMKGKYAEVLKRVKAIGIGYVDKDINIIYRND